MLLEAAIGDAYGAGFEYAPKSLIRSSNDLSSYVQHPRHLGIKPGEYTDDTQMMLAIVELMLADIDWSPRNIAEYFLNSFKRDPREGYARGFYGFLQETQTADAFLANIRPESDKSGAAMRAAPIGLYGDLGLVHQRCVDQAKITHDTPGGVLAALAAAYATHYSYYSLGPIADLPKWLCTQLPDYGWQVPWTAKVGSKGLHSAHAAICLSAQHTSMAALLEACIALTGDVDTVATIALAIASTSDEYENDLPVNLHENMENKAYGYDYLRQREAELMARFDRNLE